MENTYNSMRDAMARLQVIFEECNPEAVDAKKAELGLDEFARLRKRVNLDVKSVRQALKEREALLTSVGTTPETAESSYRIRLMIRGLKESATRMNEIVAKEAKKKKNMKDPEKLEKVEQRKEILDLINKHIEEVENLEKRRINEGYTLDRTELLSGGKPGIGGTGGHRGVGTYGTGDAKPQNPDDPYTQTDLPDIDVEEDFKAINEKNKAIDEDLEHIGAGVKKLKEMANAMGQELDGQNEALNDVDRAVNKALDHVDNVNINMRKALDGMMKGDKFMINCILICVLLALLGFIASLFQ
ncbi:hypothetical protein HK101_006503 [Irineochytrium annulatum]|nr:hypothetical protein HK101_006503 [Irineochytrium annulatum]